MTFVETAAGEALTHAAPDQIPARMALGADRAPPSTPGKPYPMMSVASP
jgi:hypothetical protein